MNASSIDAQKDVDEFALAGVTATACDMIACPRVLEAPASLECELNDVVTLQGENSYMVLGRVSGVHMQDCFIKDGLLDVTAYQPLSRLGYMDYSAVESVFSLKRPKS